MKSIRRPLRRRLSQPWRLPVSGNMHYTGSFDVEGFGITSLPECPAAGDDLNLRDTGGRPLFFLAQHIVLPYAYIGYGY